MNQFFWMLNRADKVFECVWEGTDKLEYRQSIKTVISFEDLDRLCLDKKRIMALFNVSLICGLSVLLGSISKPLFASQYGNQ